MNCHVPGYVSACLVLALSATSLAFSTFTPTSKYSMKSYAGNSTGSGSLHCPKTFRVCHAEAICGEDGKCACPSGMKGDGILGCTPVENGQCRIAADPHLVNFGGAKVDIDLPCRYKVARYVAPATEMHTEHSDCSVEVYATNELFNNRFYVRSVHVSLAIGDYGDQGKHIFEVLKQGDIKNYETNEEKLLTYNYQTNISKTSIVWGSSKQETVKGVDIKPEFDQQDSIAVLKVVQCNTEIRYRAYSKNALRQKLMPGVLIMTPPDAQFVAEFGGYPASACGSYNITSSLFQDRQIQLGLDEENFVPIYDILNAKPDQVHNPMKDSCDAAIDAFAENEDKVAATNACGVILTRPRKRRCVSEQEMEPIDAFTYCLQLQSGQLSGNQCDLYKGVASKCGLASGSC